MTSTAGTHTYTFFLTSDLLRATDRSVSSSWASPETTSSAPLQHTFLWERPKK